MTLECSLCQSRENVEQLAIEEDVYSVNGSVLRYCQSCGASTPWKKAQGEAAPSIAALPSSAPSAPHAANGASSLARQSPLAKPVNESKDIAPRAGSASAPQPVPSMPSASAYSGSFGRDLLTAAAVLETAMVATAAPPPAASETFTARPADASGRSVNRRKHVRVRVNFSACVRHSAHADEIVECENISKGGLCFHSRTKYSVGSQIDVAAPFSPGEAALFVPAQIRRVEPLQGRDVYRYGVAYLKTSSAG